MPKGAKEQAKRTSAPPADERVGSGIEELDEILGGGLLPSRTYLVRGGPGSGKTTVGWHFLAADPKSPALFITLGETESGLRRNATSIGFDLSHVHFLDLAPSGDELSGGATYDIFAPSDVESGPIMDRIKQAIVDTAAPRVFIDSLTQLRYLSPDAFQSRKQALALLHFLTEQGATVVYASESSPEAPDDDLQFIADGVIELQNRSDGRALRVSKFRGSDFQGGLHRIRLGEKGMKVFPRLVPEEFSRDFVTKPVPSGVPELDRLLHGGLSSGTVTIVSGPSGVGKTTLGTQFMKEAAGRGERSVIFAFEENKESLMHRCQAVNIPVQSMIDSGTLAIETVEPLLYTADEFAMRVRREVETKKSSIVMLDSLSGYGMSVRGSDVVERMHALCRYLTNMGVTTLLVNETESITGGDLKATEAGMSYLADTIILMRYLEVFGTLRKTVGVLKKRTGDFEKSLREVEITRYGLQIGEPLKGLTNILSGVPEVDPDRREAFKETVTTG